MKFWKILFWFLALSTFLEVTRVPFSNSVSPGDLIGLALSALMLIPYYGFAYEVNIGWKRLWQGFFILYAPTSIVLSGIATYQAVPFLMRQADMLSWLFLAFRIVLTFVLLYPPYRYAFHSEGIWSNNSNNRDNHVDRTRTV
ncbi:hypothetical protein [Ferrimonas marina]|uniref:Uncharacterized protein n=1 Tax=Ferrimonas marina TaxID=299255 RepID=A0A1M5RC20_9GAMM|nr:hypothetical protein [Ferrimonas marina]SHH23917.1 hypothetical protein SAMN02745129_1567 [Ferrimonas marina]